MLSGSIFTPHACARGKVIGSVIVVIVVVVDTKIAKSQKIGIRVLYATKQLKVKKIYLIFASNCLGWPTITTNHAFSLAIPTEHTYQCHELFPLCMFDLKIGKCH